MRTFALLVLLSASPSLAQTWSSTYPTPGDDVLWKAIEDTDGTLVVSGHSSTEGGMLARLQPDGTVLWSLTLPEAIGVLRDHALCENGDILVCGHHFGGGLVLRLDPSGTIVWQSELPWEYWGGEESLSHMFTAVEEAADGDVLLGGQSTLDPCGEPYQLYYRLDASGTRRWGFYGDYGWLSDVRELPDGSVVFTGAAYFYGVSFLKVGADGAALSERILDPIGGSRGQVARAADGNLFVVPGCFGCDYYYGSGVQLGGDYDPLEPFEISKLDPDGNVLWRRAFGAAPDVAIDVVATPDGGAVVLGETLALGGDRDLRLTRINAQGALVWQRAYGGPGDENATGLTALGDGGFMLAGRTDSGAATGLDGLLLRVSSAGEIAGCPTTVTWRTEELLVDGSVTYDPGAWSKNEDLVATDLLPDPLALLPDEVCLGLPPVGSVYCSPAVVNSSGVAAQIHTVGSNVLVDNDVTLVTTGAPGATFGYFLTGTGSGQVVPPGSQGNLCLIGSSIHRYSKTVLSTDADGSMSITIDVTHVPSHGAIQAGETWNFQAWFRDVNPTPTSNFTDAAAVMFF